MKHRVTLKTVAEACGVSMMAVSYALRGRGEVSGELRETILRTARELGYVPSRSARRLRGAGSPRIAIILPMAGSPAHMRNLQAFDLVCKEQGIEVDLHFHYWHEETERQILTRMFDEGVNGLILAPAGVGTSATLVKLQEQGLSAPFVTFGALANTPPGLTSYLGNYAPDVEALAKLCVDHLIELGHRKLAFLFQGPLYAERGLPAIARSFQRQVSQVPGAELELFHLDDSSSPLRQRILHQQPCRLEDLIETDEQMARYFLDHPYQATVAITSDDLSAVALLNECVRRKLPVPEALSIFSLGGSYICRLAALPLSHASVPMHEIARGIIDRLLAREPQAGESETFYRLSLVKAATLADLALRDPSRKPLTEPTSGLVSLSLNTRQPASPGPVASPLIS